MARWSPSYHVQTLAIRGELTPELRATAAAAGVDLSKGALIEHAQDLASARGNFITDAAGQVFEALGDDITGAVADVLQSYDELPDVIKLAAVAIPAYPAAVAAAEAVAEGSMLSWITGAWDTVTSWFSSTDAVVDAGVEVFGGLGDVSAVEVGGFGGLPDAGVDLGAFGVSGIGDSGWPELGQVGDVLGIFNDTVLSSPIPGAVPVSRPPVTGVTVMNGDMSAAGGASAVGLGLLSLGAALGRLGIRGAGTWVINGIRGTWPALWRATRRHGPVVVASALGITVAELGQGLLTHPESRRYRRRGISARDIRTTKRVVGFVSRMASQIGCVRAPAHFRRRARR